VTSAHRDHDELLIVRAAEGDADPVDARLARDQLAGCPDCRALFADLASIRNATTAAVLRVPPRPRSFRIDADTLERGRVPAWRRLLSRLGAPRYDALRPLAGAIAGIGVAVIVLSSGTLSFASPGAASIRDVAVSAAASQGTSEVYAAPGASTAAPGSSPAALPAPTEGGDKSTAFGPSGGGTTAVRSSVPSSSAGSGGSGSKGSAASAPPEAPALGTKSVDSGGPSTSAPTSNGLSPTTIGALLLLVGAAVFVLQSVARRTVGR
jgi:hypothetical protein